MSPNLLELRKYVENHDEDAFRSVVSSYIGLVYSTARRQLNGDAELAADATQIVFTDLAKLAHTLYGGTMLGGWLHRHTCFVAAKMRRAEMRRKAREKTASELRALDAEGASIWSEIAGVLDEAVNELGNEERATILLRFLEGQSLRSVGLALGISEDAAQKRIHRALEKLKLLLERKGVIISASVLGLTLSTEALTPVPAALIGSVSAAAMAGAAASPFALSTLLKGVFMTKVTATIIAIAVLSMGGLFLARQLTSQPAPKSAAGTAGVSASPDRSGAAISSSRHEPSLAATPASPLSLAEQAIDRLKKGLASENEQAVISAIGVFWMDFDTAPEAQRPAFRAAIPLFTDLWDRKSEQIKDAVLGTFKRLNPPTDRVVDIYLEALASTNEQRVSAATSDLMDAGPAARKAVPALIEQLQRNYQQNDSLPMSASLARMSLEALACIGPDAAEAVPLLTAFLQDTNELYRVTASSAYWHITRDAQTVLPVLTNALLQQNSFRAADTLKEMGPAASPALDSLREAYRTGSPDARLHAYQGLRAIDPANPPDIQGIRELLDTQNSITRLGAIETLWEYSRDPQQVLPLLLKVLPDRADFFPDVHRILTILEQMGPDAAEAAPALRELLDKPTGVYITPILASNVWTQILPGTPVPQIRNTMSTANAAPESQ